MAARPRRPRFLLPAAVASEEPDRLAGRAGRRHALATAVRAFSTGAARASSPHYRLSLV